jgi:hypothetical protein
MGVIFQKKAKDVVSGVKEKSDGKNNRLAADAWISVGESDGERLGG